MTTVNVAATVVLQVVCLVCSSKIRMVSKLPSQPLIQEMVVSDNGSTVCI